MGRYACLVLMMGVGVSVYACSSEETSTFDEKNPTADSGPPPGTFVDGGSTEGGLDAGTFVCTAKIPDPFTAGWTPPQKRSGCATLQEISDYVAACAVDLNAKEQCAAFRAAHADCTACLEPADGSGPFQWGKDRKVVRANIGGCVGLAQNDVTEDGCGFAYATSVQCQRESCDYCLDYQTLSSSDLSKCQNSAKQQGICASRENLVKNKCQGLSGADASTAACVPTSSAEPPGTYYPRLAAVFCAPPI